MNLLLKFHNNSLRRKYLDHLTQRFMHCILFLDLFISVNLISTSIYFSICVFNTLGVYCLSGQQNLLFAILGLLWMGIFSLIALYLHFKRKTYSEFLLLISYFYFLAMITDLFRNGELSPAISYIITLVNLLFMTVYRLLFVKTIHLIGNLVYFVWFYATIGFKDKEFIFFEITALSVFFVGVLYFIERSEKTIFFNNFSFEREKRAFNELLDILPEGIAIFSKNMKDIFINGSMRNLYEENDAEKLLSKMFKETRKKLIPTSFEVNPICSNSDASFECNQSLKNIPKKAGCIKSINMNSLKNSLFLEVTLELVFQQFVRKLNEKASTETLKGDVRIGKESTVDTTTFQKNTFHFENAKASPGLSKVESFSAEFQNKTFLIKILSIRFNSRESVLIIANDMTESVKLRALEEANEYKNTLFASFTHEFRTPLNCLFAMLHGISQENEVSPIVKINFVKPAYFNCEILYNLVNAISDYSLLSLGKMRLERKIVNIRELFDKSLESLRYQAEKKQIEVKLEVDKELPEELKTDPKRLQQILFQLYSNAIKFTYKGTIKIKVKQEKMLGNGIKIAVKDTGIGMGEKDRTRLEASLSDQASLLITKAKASHNSIGASLGLTVSQQIAKMLGFPKGKGIYFKSGLGAGSKFSFVIKNNFKDYSKEFQTKGMTVSSFKNNGIYEEIESPLIFRVTPVDKKMPSSESLPKEGEFTNSKNFNDKYGFIKENNYNMCSLDSVDQLKKFELSTNNFGTFEKLFRNYDSLVEPKTETGLTFDYFISKPCSHEPVLIVDDDEFNILALSSILNMRKIKSLAARNGKLALDLIKLECGKRKDCCKRFQMIFMDLNMPVLNGIETSLELRRMKDNDELPDMPIIAFTAFEMEIEKNECFKAGMVEYMTKPIDIMRLNSLVEKYLMKK